MNSHDLDTRLDNLFREALQAERQVAPPDDAWQHIEQALSPMSVSWRGRLDDVLDLLRRRWIRVGVGFRDLGRRLPSWSRVVSWVQGGDVLYPSPVGSLIALGPELGLLPPPFSSVLTKQISDLRLVFGDLNLDFN
jgi:hypothetical protein